MARIKIKDLPKDMKISKERMKTINGGFIALNSWMAQPTLTQPVRVAYPVRIAVNNTDTGRFAINNTDFARF